MSKRGPGLRARPGPTGRQTPLVRHIMKKIILSGLLALGAALASQQEAAAWVNFKFSAGINWQLQSGNNNFLWGVFRNGQVPGAEGYPGGMPYHGGPGPHGYGSQFPYFGQAAPVPTAPAAAAPTGTAATSTPAQQTYWQGGNPFHTVGYNPSYNPYTPASYPGYYYPNYYGYYYAPSYWYGR